MNHHWCKFNRRDCWWVVSSVGVIVLMLVSSAVSLPAAVVLRADGWVKRDADDRQPPGFLFLQLLERCHIIEARSIADFPKTKQNRLALKVGKAGQFFLRIFESKFFGGQFAGNNRRRRGRLRKFRAMLRPPLAPLLRAAMDRVEIERRKWSFFRVCEFRQRVARTDSEIQPGGLPRQRCGDQARARGVGRAIEHQSSGAIRR